ncbi:MAG: LysM peptidoglycan-binding domain-containing protein, partial [Candidatus Flemingiibacterium sp.]
MIIYTVRPGDTVNSIASRFGVPAERIILDNEIQPEKLSVGQALVVA